MRFDNNVAPFVEDLRLDERGLAAQVPCGDDNLFLGVRFLWLTLAAAVATAVAVAVGHRFFVLHAEGADFQEEGIAEQLEFTAIRFSVLRPDGPGNEIAHL